MNLLIKYEYDKNNIFSQATSAFFESVDLELLKSNDVDLFGIDITDIGTEKLNPFNSKIPFITTNQNYSARLKQAFGLMSN